MISKWGGLVSPSCFADVGRFNPPGREARGIKRDGNVEEGEKESPSSYFVDTLRRVVLQGDSQTVRAAQFSFSASIPLPPPPRLRPLFRLHGGWPRVSSARVIDHGRFRPTRYPLPTTIPATMVNKERRESRGRREMAIVAISESIWDS